MRFFLVLVFIVAGAAAKAAPVGPVLVLGDSLSAAHDIPRAAGWVELLRRRLEDMRPRRTLINASVSGETSAAGLARLPDLLATHKPSVLVLELGANDGLRGLPLDLLRGNLKSMVDLAHAAGARVLLLGVELPVNYGPRYRDELRAVYAGLAREHGLALVPFFLEGVALDPALMQADGLHPNANAQPRILENVWPALAPLLEAAD